MLSRSSAGARNSRQWWVMDLDALAHESEMPHIWLPLSFAPDPVPSSAPLILPPVTPAVASSASEPNTAVPSAGLLKMRKAVKTVLV